MKRIRYILLVIILTTIAAILFEIRPVIKQKWIEPEEVKPLICEFDANGTIKLVKYAFLYKKRYIILTNELNYVDSITWFNSEIGTGLEGSYPNYYVPLMLPPPNK